MPAKTTSAESNKTERRVWNKTGKSDINKKFVKTAKISTENILPENETRKRKEVNYHLLQLVDNKVPETNLVRGSEKSERKSKNVLEVREKSKIAKPTTMKEKKEEVKEATSEKAAPKKRGRKPGQKVAPKKKRGRKPGPKKTEQVPEKMEVEKEEEEEKEKEIPAVASTTTAPSSPAPATPVKRGRGRPKKIRPVETPAEVEKPKEKEAEKPKEKEAEKPKEKEIEKPKEKDAEKPKEKEAEKPKEKEAEKPQEKEVENVVVAALKKLGGKQRTEVPKRMGRRHIPAHIQKFLEYMPVQAFESQQYEILITQWGVEKPDMKKLKSFEKFSDAIVLGNGEGFLFASLKEVPTVDGDFPIHLGFEVLIENGKEIEPEVVEGPFKMSEFLASLVAK